MAESSNQAQESDARREEEGRGGGGSGGGGGGGGEKARGPRCRHGQAAPGISSPLIFASYLVRADCMHEIFK
eukprot:COSAG05_NODE_1010_length_6207_cov_3.771447_4_plen_72_part_00